MRSVEVLAIIGLVSSIHSGLCAKPIEPYYGRKIGNLVEFAHGIKGTAYAVDESTIFIKGFYYDGTGPDAFFWIGNSPRPSPEGTIIPYPEDYNGRDPPVLRAYNNTDIILRLPMGKRIRDIRWLSVWCRRFTVDFGEVFIPPNLEVPKPRVLPEFKRLAHGLRSDNISILDAKTFYIPNLHYDGAGPDAYFWVGNGSEPTSFGIKVPNEMGSLEPLRGYQGEDIEIQLPGLLTVYDIDWLGIWCVQYRHNFGHVNIPKDLDVPPALGQTKVSVSMPSQHSASKDPEQPKKKKKDGVQKDHFNEPDSEYQVIARNWAFKLERMSGTQRRLAEKFINEIIFEGEEGTLHRHSVAINSIIQ